MRMEPLGRLQDLPGTDELRRTIALDCCFTAAANASVLSLEEALPRQVIVLEQMQAHDIRGLSTIHAKPNGRQSARGVLSRPTTRGRWDTPETCPGCLVVHRDKIDLTPMSRALLVEVAFDESVERD